MEHDEQRPESHESPVVVPESIELIDPRRDGSPHQCPPPRRPLRSRKRLVLLLFLATCLSTFWVGMMQTPPGELTLGTALFSGISYAGPLMLILLAHEMGHYLQARRYGVPATLPYFIPMPIFPFGTMGAVIVQGAGVADRKALFDIAVTGPLAGLALALPVAYFGVLQSKLAVIPAGYTGWIFGDPPILRWMIETVHGPLAQNQEVVLNPLLFAGWVGIFITALNLIPIGQLDGGHILYTLIGRRAHTVAILLLVGAVGFMVYTGYPAYALMVVLLVLMGPRHPPTADDDVELGQGRVILGWVTLAFILVGFTMMPIKDVDPVPVKPAPQRAPTWPLAADVLFCTRDFAAGLARRAETSCVCSARGKPRG